MRYEQAVEHQTCDSCNAKPGEPCRTLSGGERTIPHEPRAAVAGIKVDVRSVYCPECFAKPGEPCRTKKNGPAAHHKRRITEAIVTRALQ